MISSACVKRDFLPGLPLAAVEGLTAFLVAGAIRSEESC